MHRLEKLRNHIDGILHSVVAAYERRCGFLHLYGVAQAAALLAERKGLAPDIAAAAAMLHDIYTYRTGHTALHSHNSAEEARPVLRDMGIFSQEEQLLILSAVFHHSDKTHRHDEYDEILKNADVLQHYLYNPALPVSPGNAARLEHTLAILGYSTTHQIRVAEVKHNKASARDKRALLANIAEKMADEKIVGEPGNITFAHIARRWPDTLEHKSIEQLAGNWCAAFVHHCCQEAGFLLPFRHPNVSCRFAAVRGWYEWSTRREINLFTPAETGYIPQRGDIVIFRDSIPPQKNNAPSGTLDHIGIVLKNLDRHIIVAEGNADNSNLSAIMARDRSENIAGYIHMDNDFEYEGWKTDYKTGQERVETYSPYHPVPQSR